MTSLQNSGHRGDSPKPTTAIRTASLILPPSFSTKTRVKGIEVFVTGQQPTTASTEDYLTGIQRWTMSASGPLPSLFYPGIPRPTMPAVARAAPRLFSHPLSGFQFQNLHRFRLDLGIGQRAFTITLVNFLNPLFGYWWPYAPRYIEGFEIFECRNLLIQNNRFESFAVSCTASHEGASLLAKPLVISSFFSSIIPRVP